MRIGRSRTASLAAVAIIPLAAPASAGELGKKVAEGSGYRYASAEKEEIRKPKRFTVMIESDQPREFIGGASVTCSKGPRGFKLRHNDTSGVTPVTQRLEHPFDKPDECDVSADAFVMGGDHPITVKIFVLKRAR